MYKQGSPFKNIISGVKNALSNSSKNFSNNAIPSKKLKIEKVLLVSKLSRFDYERNKYKHLTDNELIEELRQRGTDVEKLLFFHNVHKNFEKKVETTLINMGIEIQIANKLNYSNAKVKWADIVVPTGGDGTFLFAASKVPNSKTPVIGLNSDPNRSEGFLCVPKKYSSHINEVIERLRKGQFEWQVRNRIRITLAGKIKSVMPKHLYDFDVLIEPSNESDDDESTGKNEHVLPTLALNEVFIGENLAARASHLLMRLNTEKTLADIKCSGVCICTGTGSSSWHLSINRLSDEAVSDLVAVANLGKLTGKTVEEITNEYNKRLIFSPDDTRLGFTIRDLISGTVWPKPKGIKSRGFADKIEVQSKCFDAYLVLDGGISFAFSDGAIARMGIYPEDALRTVIFPD